MCGLIVQLIGLWEKMQTRHFNRTQLILISRHVWRILGQQINQPPGRDASTTTMPLSPSQRAAMDEHIRVHTRLNWHYHTGYTQRTYIVDSVERVMDSGRTCIRALSLPDQYVWLEGADFWRQMAAIALGGDEFDWHEMAFGNRRVYTWGGGGEMKFYTKKMRSEAGYYWLEWYVCKLVDEDDGSGADTESEDVPRLE